MKPLKEADLEVFGKNVTVYINCTNIGNDYIPKWKQGREEKLNRLVRSYKEEYIEKYARGFLLGECRVSLLAKIMTTKNTLELAVYDGTGNFKYFTEL